MSVLQRQPDYNKLLTPDDLLESLGNQLLIEALSNGLEGDIRYTRAVYDLLHDCELDTLAEAYPYWSWVVIMYLTEIKHAR